MSTTDATPPMTPAMRLLRVLGLIAAGVVPAAACFYLLGGSTPPAGRGFAEQAPVLHVIVGLVLGGLALAAGTALYALAVATCGFTFRFDRPSFATQRRVYWLLNVAVLTLWAVGIGLALMAVTGPALARLGLDRSLGAFLAMMIALVGVQAAAYAGAIWAPLERRYIRKRLEGAGVGAAEIERGRMVGLSDPEGKTPRFATIEEDVGMLWLDPDALVYRGDARALRIERSRLVAVERAVNPRSLNALAGTVDVILQLQHDDGRVARLRLHPEGVGSLRATARASEQLALALERWRAAA